MELDVKCWIMMSAGIEAKIRPNHRQGAVVACLSVIILTIVLCFVVAIERKAEGEAWLLGIPCPYISLSGQDFPQFYIFVTGLTVAAAMQLWVSHLIFCWLECFRSVLPAEDAADEDCAACCWWSTTEVGKRAAELRSAVWICGLYSLAAITMAIMAWTNYRPTLDKSQYLIHTWSANVLFFFMTWAFLLYVWHMERLTYALAKPPGGNEISESVTVDEENEAGTREAIGATEVAEEELPPAIEVSLEVHGAGRPRRRGAAGLILFLAVCNVGVGDTWMKAYCANNRDRAEMSMQECRAVGLTQSYCDDFRKPGNPNELYLLDLNKLGDSCITAITFHAVSQYLLVLGVLVVHMAVIGWDIAINPTEPPPERVTLPERLPEGSSPEDARKPLHILVDTQPPPSRGGALGTSGGR